MTVFSPEFRQELTDKIKALPPATKEREALHSLTDNAAHAEFREIWQAARPPAPPKPADGDAAEIDLPEPTPVADTPRKPRKASRSK